MRERSGHVGPQPRHQVGDDGAQVPAGRRGDLALADVRRAVLDEGRDVEQLVLSRAVRLWAQDRVFLNRERTVVFSS